MLKNSRSSALIGFPHPFLCSLGLGKAPSCGEKRAGVCVFVFVNQHKGIFAHPHAQIHGDVLKKGRNVTDRAREEKDSSSSLRFSLLFFCFLLHAEKKNSYKTQTKQKSCAGEDRNQQEPSCDYKGRLQRATQITRKKDASRKRTATSCSFRSQYRSLWMCQWSACDRN